MSVYEMLLQKKESEFRELTIKNVPNISKESIIGVRTPFMRQIAKELFGTKEAQEFLKVLPHKYFEENLIHFFLISLIKDFDECIKEVERFLPFVDCWCVSDQSSPKVFKKNHQKLLPFIKKWIASDHVYTSRFGIRILMNEFLEEDFQTEYLELVSAKKGDDYYLKMMIAWYFATALAKRYDESVKFIENKKLDKWTHNKAIQKAIESFRVSDEHKQYLKTLKIKGD